MNRIYLYLVLAASVSALATDMIVPALPDLQKVFQVDYSLIQLSISGFLIVYAISQLCVGFLGERLGKIKTITAGFIIFSAGSLLCFMAKDIYLLMAGRFIQAVGAGAGPVLSRAIAKDSFPADRLKKALSDISSASAVVPLLAPLAGGAMLGYVSWNYIFLTMFIFGVITVIIAPKNLPAAKEIVEEDNGSFLTKEFFSGTALVSLILSSLFCFITLTPVIFIENLKFTPFQYSLVFSISVLFFIAGNQASKVNAFTNPFLLFGINVLSLFPLIIGEAEPVLYIISAILFNFTLGAYYPIAHFTALQIKGKKTGIASSLTGFTQTVCAGLISYCVTKSTSFGIGFEKVMGISGLSLAVLSLLVVSYLRRAKCRTGKETKLRNP